MKKEITFRSIWQIGARFRRKLCTVKELRNALHQAISDLKPIYRDVLVLRRHSASKRCRDIRSAQDQ